MSTLHYRQAELAGSVVSSEQEQVIDKAIQAGLARDGEDAAGVGVRMVRLLLEAASRAAKTLPQEECSKAFHAWIASHPWDTRLLSEKPSAASRSTVTAASRWQSCLT